MGAENWSLSNEKESLEALKYLAGNRFIDEIRSQAQDKTIEWRLDNWNITGEHPTVLVMDRKHHLFSTNYVLVFSKYLRKVSVFADTFNVIRH